MEESSLKNSSYAGCSFLMHEKAKEAISKHLRGHRSPATRYPGPACALHGASLIAPGKADPQPTGKIGCDHNPSSQNSVCC